MSEDNGGIQLPRFHEFAPEILDGLESAFEKSPFADFDTGAAFVFWVADLFETTDDSRFTYTDGGREHGIDFFVEDAEDYYIYQCKSVDEQTLQSTQSTPTFDATAVNELLEGVDYLRDTDASYTNTKPAIRDLRARYQRSLASCQEESCNLYATLAVLGDLTKQAQERFDAEKERLSEEGVYLRLHTWRDIYSAIHALDLLPPKSMSIDLRVDNNERDILKQNDWIHALVYAHDLVDAQEDYGVRLFDLNVRNEIRLSRVNKAIVDKLKTTRGRKWFFHYNNGLLITCTNYTLPKGTSTTIRVNRPQIINGCQTVLLPGARISGPATEPAGRVQKDR